MNINEMLIHGVIPLDKIPMRIRLASNKPETSPRSCGSCTLCCKVLSIEEIGKPERVWCKDCSPGIGCRIYDSRPDACSSFKCMWLVGSLREDQKPDRVKVVVSFQATRLDDPNSKVWIQFTESMLGASNQRWVGDLVTNFMKQNISCMIISADGQRHFLEAPNAKSLGQLKKQLGSAIEGDQLGFSEAEKD